MSQSSAELARKSRKKTPHQRQSFAREQHRSTAPLQPGSTDSLPAPAESAVLKQKQTGVPEGPKAAAPTTLAAGNTAEKRAALAKKVAKPLKKRAKASVEVEADPGQTEAADVEPMKQKKRKRLEQDSKGVHEQTAEEKAQSRLASFAKPTLAGPGSASQPRKKPKQQAEEPAQVPEQLAGPTLTKAQRKNMWRAKRRAMQHKGRTADHAS